MKSITGNMKDKVKRITTTINWQPSFRNVVLIDNEKNNEDTLRLKANGLISINELSDKELLDLGGISKAANLANATSEEQRAFEIVAIGPEVAYHEVGDIIINMPGAQATSIKIDGKYYLQMGEYEILGKFL